MRANFRPYFGENGFGGTEKANTVSGDTLSLQWRPYRGLASCSVGIRHAKMCPVITSVRAGHSVVAARVEFAPGDRHVACKTATSVPAVRNAPLSGYPETIGGVPWVFRGVQSLWWRVFTFRNDEYLNCVNFRSAGRLINHFTETTNRKRKKPHGIHRMGEGPPTSMKTPKDHESFKQKLQDIDR